MKAITYQSALAINDPDYLLDVDLPSPCPQAHELLIEIKAVAVNPVDLKIRQRITPEPGEYKILGWDAVGVVKETGKQTRLFKAGDEVWYAGALHRPGCNAQFQCIDERIVAHKPCHLNFAQAAALPLTGLTAWELLFDRLQIQTHPPAQSILITGAAGGVGSVMIQLLKTLTNIRVIATASRSQSQQWVKQLGADIVINHQHDLAQQLTDNDVSGVDFVASLSHTEQHFAQLANCLLPQGKLALIDDPENIDIRLLKQKSISLHWEFMYTRSLFDTADLIKQHHILSQLASLVDQKRIMSTQQQHLGTINAVNLQRAHCMIDSGNTIGKIVLEGFEN